jgi:hypothetical protein
MKRLTDKHPAKQALERVFELMEKEGLKIELGHYGALTLIFGEEEFEMCDLEFPRNGTGSGIYNLPPTFEYQLIIPEEEQ